MSIKDNNRDVEIIAVFIDGDNISYKNIPLILQEIQSYGKIIINNIYCDWSSPSCTRLKQAAIENGITTIQCDMITGKNSTDIKLMVDIMKTLYEINHISLYYIVTSDSDYRHVIPQIKIKNKKVNCIGSVKSNKSIQNICDLFTKIEVLENFNRRFRKESESNKDLLECKPYYNTINKKNLKVTHRLASIKQNLGITSNINKIDDNVIKKIDENIIIEIKNVIENNKRINLGALKTLLQRKYTFDYREYNCNSMKSFIEKNSSELQCQVIGNEYVSSIIINKNKRKKKYKKNN